MNKRLGARGALAVVLGIAAAIVVGPAAARADSPVCGQAAGGFVVHGQLPLPKSKCTFYGPGTLTIASDGSAKVSKVLAVASNLHVLNQGVVYPGWCDTQLDVQDTSVFENAASFTSTHCRLAVTGPATAALINDAGASFVARNTSIAIPTTNNGYLITNGMLSLGRLTNLSDGVLTGGSYQVSGQYGAMYLPGPVTENDADIELAGAGRVLDGAHGGGSALSGLRANGGSLSVDNSQAVGALTNTGALEVDSAGALSATGAVTLDPAGHLDVGIGSDTSADKIDASGPIALGGALQIDTDDGFVPVPGRTYTVAASSAGVTGTFSSVTGLDVTSNEHYVLTYGPTSVTLRADAGPIPLRVYSASPNPIGQNAASVTMTVTGTGFRAGALVGFGGSDVLASSSTVVDNTKLTVQVSVSATATLGPRDVKVRNPGAGGGVATCSGCLTITAHPDPTAVSGPIGTNVQSVTLTLQATGVQYNSQLTVLGHPNAITGYFQPNQASAGPLVLTVPADTPVGTYSIRLVNPDHGSGTCVDCLTVVAAPTVTGVTPGSVVRGSTQNVTVGGSGFTAGAVPRGPSGVTYSNVTVVDATTITATMKVSGTATPGPNKVVTVVNGQAGGYGLGTFTGLTIV